jgi:hypothetical protein
LQSGSFRLDCGDMKVEAPYRLRFESRSQAVGKQPDWLAWRRG